MAGKSDGEQVSLLALSLRFEGVTTDQCDVCGATFANPRQTLSLTGKRDSWQVDVGGFCPTCMKYSCPKHVVLIDKEDDGDIKWPEGYGTSQLACQKCSTGLVTLTEEYRVKLAQSREALGRLVDLVVQASERSATGPVERRSFRERLRRRP